VTDVTLSDYLSSVLRRRFGYGDLDCCIFMADWLIAIGLPDPMADRRSTYSNRKEYRAAIRSEGGLVTSCRRRFADIGLRETETAEPGDVCLVKTPALFGRRVAWIATGAIAVSDKLRAVVTPDAGLVVAPANTLLTWTF
jgi:hypothetical protein